ncbi:MAG: CDP-diacylglycerol--serine O-phosphatidyltransferase [bacterium]
MKKGIYILPNLFTLANMLCGFYSIISTIDGRFHHAAVAIFVAALFDGLDGRIARLTGTCSRFGVEFDSLADLLSFGMAPALLIYLWALHPYQRIGWLAAFLFVICGALRLARFNVQVYSPESKNHFTGLPIPAAASTIASFVLLHQFLFGDEGSKPIFIAGLAYLLAFLMVSNIKYRNFKQLKLRERKPFNLLVLMSLVLLVILAQPQIMVFILISGYVLSGLVEKIFLHKFEGTYEISPEKRKRFVSLSHFHGRRK